MLILGNFVGSYEVTLREVYLVSEKMLKVVPKNGLDVEFTENL